MKKRIIIKKGGGVLLLTVLLWITFIDYTVIIGMDLYHEINVNLHESKIFFFIIFPIICRTIISFSSFIIIYFSIIKNSSHNIFKPFFSRFYIKWNIMIEIPFYIKMIFVICSISVCIYSIIMDFGNIIFGYTFTYTFINERDYVIRGEVPFLIRTLSSLIIIILLVKSLRTKR